MPLQLFGGVKVKVVPLAGKTDGLMVHVALFNVPPVVDAQLVVVVLLLKVAFVLPRKPT